MKTTLITAAALSLALLPAFAQVETTPPPPAAPRQLQIPKPVEKTLANGLRVIVIEKKGVPLVAARLLIKNGGEADPANLPGLADTTASLLTKGTTTKSAEEIARGIEALGATLETSAGWDESSADVSVMSSKLPQALGFLADVVRHPTFKQEEIDRLRHQNVDALSVAMKQPGRLASFVMTRAIFGTSPYGHYLGGTPESLTRIKRDDVVAFHRNYYRPDNAILVLGGDIAPAKAFATAQELFGAWKAAADSHPAPLASTKEFPSPHVIVVDMPSAGQAAVVAGRAGLRRSDPAYHLSLVTNSILGGGYSSRLNEEIRIKRGLSYGAGSSFDLRRDVGPFTATVQTKNESAGEVAGLVIDELNKLGTTPVEDAEIGPRKAVLIGGFGRQLETNAGLVGRIGTLALYGLSLDEINHYISGVQAITAADIRKFAAAHLGGNDASLVIVGDAKKFLPKLQERFKNVEVIPIDELDVNSPTLRKGK
ncbi:MAG TPA: insulinase family protein [Thermoanaerobaculia bacterium]|jgi:zinc protease|nr:insulinase family protein [Thermoanaerobaculia bacterium]